MTRNKKTVIFATLVLVLAFSAGWFFYQQNKESAYEKVILSGELSFPVGLTIEEDEIAIIKPGTILKFGKDSRLSVKGKIRADGTPSNPIIFEGDGDYWGGIMIEGQGETPVSADYWQWLKGGDSEKEKAFFNQMGVGNSFSFAYFKNISTPSRAFAIGNKWKAAVEGYDTAISVKNSVFEDILHVGGLLVQRSYIVAVENDFASDTLHKDFNATDNSVGIVYKNRMVHKKEKAQRCADGIWINGSTFLMAENEIEGSADDGIDADNSLLVVYGNRIKNALDDGMDIDSRSFAYVIENTIADVPGSAALISDESKAVLFENDFSTSREGLAIRDGARVTARDLTLRGNEKGVRVYQDFPCALNERDFLVVLAVLSRMSGAQVVEQGIDGVSETAQLASALLESYEKKDDMWYLKKKEYDFISDFKVLKEIFKLTDISGLDLEYVYDRQTENNPVCIAMKNAFFMTNSVLAENRKDLVASHKYSINIEGTTFSTDEAMGKIMELLDKNFTCSLVDETNVSVVRSNARKILKKREVIGFAQE